MCERAPGFLCVFVVVSFCAVNKQILERRFLMHATSFSHSSIHSCIWLHVPTRDYDVFPPLVRFWHRWSHRDKNCALTENFELCPSRWRIKKKEQAEPLDSDLSCCKTAVPRKRYYFPLFCRKRRNSQQQFVFATSPFFSSNSLYCTYTQFHSQYRHLWTALTLFRDWHRPHRKRQSQQTDIIALHIY